MAGFTARATTSQDGRLPAFDPTCVDIQRGVFGSVLDTQIATDTADPIKVNKNYGEGLAMIVGTVSGTCDRKTLLWFDLASIPTGAIVDSATMTLQARAGSAGSIRVHRVNTTWDESTVTWNSFFGSSSPQIDSTVVTTVTGAPGAVVFNVTSLARQWASGTPNHGAYLTMSDATNTNFHTSEDVAEKRPRLSVCYRVLSP